MNTEQHIDHIEKHTAHSEHLAELAHTHNTGMGVYYDPDHLELNGIAISPKVIEQIKVLLPHQSVAFLSDDQLDHYAAQLHNTGSITPHDPGSIHASWGDDEGEPLVSYERVEYLPEDVAAGYDHFAQSIANHWQAQSDSVMAMM